MNLEPRTSNRLSAFSVPRSSFIVAFVALTLLVCLAYGNSLRVEFVGDDVLIVASNPTITKLRAFPELLTSDYWANYRGGYYEAGIEQSSGLYRPLTMATYAMNYALFGLNPVGYHLGNLLFHLLDTWVLFLIAIRLGMVFEAALAAAAVFAVHPIHTEAVTGVVGRAELLMAGGVLSAIWGHLAGKRAVSWAGFACGILAKEQAIILPFVLLTYDACLLWTSSAGWEWARWKRWGRAAFPEYSGYVVLLLGYLALRTTVLGGVAAPPAGRIENPLVSLIGLSWFLTALKVAGMYMTVFFWPAMLAADYSSNAIPAVHSVLEPTVVWGLVSWGTMVALTAWSFFREPRVLLSAALCILAYLPASNLLVTIGTIMAERLFYLPSAGLCLLVGLAYERAATRGVVRRTTYDVQSSELRDPPNSNAEPRTSNFELRTILSSYVARRTSLLALRVVLVLLCVALTVRTVVRNHDWQEPERLFRGVIEAFPANAKAYIWWAGTLTDKGQYQAALDAYDTAVKLNPDYPKRDAKFNLERSSVLFKVGRLQEALETAEQAVTLDPKWGVARNQLGLTYARLGDFDKAEAVFRYAVLAQPESADLRGSLSLILNERGRYEEALRAADAALQLDPAHPWALVNRAIALEGLHRSPEAKTIYEHVLTLRPRREQMSALEEAKERLEELQPRQAVPRCDPGIIRCK